jgi:AcrR family transcriptional regulator
MTKREGSTRQRILSAAARKFETDGIRGATINSIAADAGVTKRTLYYHFRSKDDLISATLTDEQLVDRSDVVFVDPADPRPLEALVKDIFAAITEQASNIRWKGCAFSRTAAELAGFPGHPAVSAAKEYKNRIESAFIVKFEAIGVESPPKFARRLMILLDGALTHSLIHHNPEYSMEASRMALEMIFEARDLAASRSLKWRCRASTPCAPTGHQSTLQRQKLSA